jgi:hypothetical protein
MMAIAVKYFYNVNFNLTGKFTQLKVTILSHIFVNWSLAWAWTSQHLLMAVERSTQVERDMLEKLGMDDQVWEKL